MIITENTIINDKNYIKTYSSKGMYITRDGQYYSEAYDLPANEYEYTETNEPIDKSSEDVIIELQNEVEELKEQNEFLADCILEMADIVYA